MTEPLPRLPGLRVLGPLGRGGMGEVLLAEERGLGRRVAVKRLECPDPAAAPEARRRFEREARTLAALDHPHLVTVHRLGESGRRLFLVMELVEGGSLADRLRDGGALPVAEAVEILRQAVAGLAAAWERGIVHRDVKPSNLLFDGEGRVKVADFGLARPVAEGGDRVTRTGLVVGSPHYMAPEQIRGEELDLRSDVYSLGVVLFEMLSGRAPFEGRSQGAILAAQLAEPLPDLSALRPDLPDGLVRGVERLTAKEPGDRPATPDAVVAALTCDGPSAGPGAAAVTSVSRRPEPVAGRGPSRRTVAAALWGAVVLGAAALVPVFRDGPASPPAPPAAATGSGAPSAAREPSVEPFGSLGSHPGASGGELARALERRATGPVQLEWRGGAGVRVELGSRGRPLLLHVRPGGGIRLLHPPPGQASEPVAPGRGVRLPAPAADAGGGWLVLVATERPLPPPALLGARPAGSGVDYPVRVAGGSGTVHPAYELLTWLTGSLGTASGPWSLAVRPSNPGTGRTRPQADDAT